jgi:hypothetical protein
LLRYYLIATAIVLTIAVAATAWQYRDLIRIRISSTTLPAPPRREPPNRNGGVGGGSLHGDAPWALSALPDCLRQTEESTGSLAYVRSHLPAGATAIVPPATLTYGPCTISVADGEAYVSRGTDRLRIPPHVQFYRKGAVLALLRTSDGFGELRLYEPPTQQQ